jgi:sulfur carrier protein ThiS
MKITVKVYGTLTKYLPDYNHAKGLELEFPDPVDAAALIDHLGIPRSNVGMVSVNGQPASADDPFPDQAVVQVFQPIFGG